MDAFVKLIVALDATTKTNARQSLLADWFRAVPPADAAWGLFFLSGRKLPQPLPVRRLRELAARIAAIPPWLFEECYAVVGDLAETVALLLPETLPADGSTAAAPASGLWSEPIRALTSTSGLAAWVDERLLPLRGADDTTQERLLRAAWSDLHGTGRFVWNKLLTGGFRVGVSQALVVKGLSEATGLSVDRLAHRLTGDWSPTPEFYLRLISAEGEDSGAARPYPFALANPLLPPSTLSVDVPLDEIRTVLDCGPDDAGLTRWLAEWKWDGIRAQLLRRSGDPHLWSRGDELLSERFPELHADARRLPVGTVLDGEIVAWRDGRVLPFTRLQQRITRKAIGRKLLAEVPCVFIAFDLLEFEGVDLRGEPLHYRRRMLERLFAETRVASTIHLADAFTGRSLTELAALREESRNRGVEGLMLKRLDSRYATGRERGDWWKWKVDPYTIDAVLVAAQVGHGRRANLFTDYTFAVWDGETLVPFAKAYSGLTDAEMKAIDAFVRSATVDKFGPVRSVRPELVFELAFENLQRSSRHRSGIAVRFPRILRQRTDKTIRDADTLDRILALLPWSPDEARPARSAADSGQLLFLRGEHPVRQRTFPWADDVEETG